MHCPDKEERIGRDGQTKQSSGASRHASSSTWPGQNFVSTSFELSSPHTLEGYHLSYRDSVIPSSPGSLSRPSFCTARGLSRSPLWAGKERDGEHGSTYSVESIETSATSQPLALHAIAASAADHNGNLRHVRRYLQPRQHPACFGRGTTPEGRGTPTKLT